MYCIYNIHLFTTYAFERCVSGPILNIVYRIDAIAKRQYQLCPGVLAGRDPCSFPGEPGARGPGRGPGRCGQRGPGTRADPIRGLYQKIPRSYGTEEL